MPQEVRLWEVKGKELMKIPKSKLGLEEYLEKWLEHDISIVSDDLLVIGRQVGTAYRKAIDLLCLNRNGDVVIVELKRDRTPRDVIAQILDYASWVDDLLSDEVASIADEYLNRKGMSLEEAFENKFNVSLPEVLNDSHEMLIVASELDDQAERVISYLSRREIGINAVTFNYFEKDDKKYFALVLLIPKSAEEMRRKKRRYNLPEGELRDIAEKNGVGKLYSTMVDGVTSLSLFDRKGTTLSSIAFYGLQEGKMNTIFSIIPEESNKKNGLNFQVYLKRFSKYFDITDVDAEEILPKNKKEWNPYPKLGVQYSGFEGFFRDKEEIETFLSKLQELKTKPE